MCRLWPVKCVSRVLVKDSYPILQGAVTADSILIFPDFKEPLRLATTDWAPWEAPAGAFLALEASHSAATGSILGDSKNVSMVLLLMAPKEESD